MLLTKIVQTASDLLTPQKGMNHILYDPQKVATLCNDLLKERKSIDSPRALLMLFLVI